VVEADLMLATSHVIPVNGGARAPGSDATLDNAHVAEDYLARTTTMYRIIQW
jgi:hypothetical protein